VDRLVKKQEELRSEFEATLNVLMARQSSARDFEDWQIIERQTKTLLQLAGRLRNLAGV